MQNKKLPTKLIISVLIIIVLALIFYALVINFSEVNRSFALFLKVVSPFLVGIVISFILNPLFTKIKTSLFKNCKYSTAFSLILTYTIAFGAIAIIVYFALPELVQSIVTLADRLPEYIRELDKNIYDLANYFGLDLDDTQTLYNYWTSISNKLLLDFNQLVPKVLAISRNIIAILINGLIAFITSIYLLADKEKFLNGSKRIIIAFTKKEHTDRVLEVCHSANQIFKGFLTGKIIDSIIIGIICFVFMLIAGLPYASLVSTIVGVTNIIPVFGPFIGAIPGSIIMLSVSPMHCIVFIIWIIILQQFDGNILGPKILGDYTGISAIWILVVVTIGGGLFGFLGMLFAVPVFAVFYKFFAEYVDYRIKKKEE